MRRMLQNHKNFFNRSISIVLSGLLSVMLLPEAALAAMASDTDAGTAPSDDALQMQTITAVPEEETESEVTLDGMLPAGAEVSVRSSDNSAEGSLCAYDITITDKNGEEFQPESDAPIQVELRSPAITEAAAQEKPLRVWHLHDGIREEITSFTLQGDALVFQTDGFSVFEVDNGEPPLRTYVFEMPADPSDNSGYTKYYFPTAGADAGGNHKMICQQIVKNGEKLVFPQLPADVSSRYTFTGWYVCNNGVLADAPFDFDQEITGAQNEIVTLRAVFKACVYVIFHEQYNAASERFPIMATRSGELTPGQTVDVYGEQTDQSAEVRIKDLTVTYDDLDKTPGEPMQMAFKGWTVVPDTCVTQEQIKAYTERPDVQVIRTETIRISKTTRLYPVFWQIGWLDFNTNQDGSGNDANHYTGATYKPPVYFPTINGFNFIDKEQKPPKLAGYVFDGWFTGDGVPVTDSALHLIDGLDTDYLENRNGTLFFKECDPRTAQVNLYAHWKPDDSKYTIVLWMQQASDTPDLGIDAEGKDHRHWDFFKSYSQTAKTGTSVSVAEMYRPEKLENLDQELIPGTHTRDKLKGFTIDHWDDAQTVEGNGGTILNVYYKRNQHTFTFRNTRNTRDIHKVTALYGSDISNIWHFTDDDGNTYPMTTGGQTTSWMPVVNGQDGVRITQMLLMPDKDITFRHYTTSNTQRTFHYYVEALPDTPDTPETRTYNGKKYIPYNENLGTLKHDFEIVNYNADFFELEGFTRLAIATTEGADVTTTIQNATGQGAGWQRLGTNELWFYYTRNSYNAEFKDPKNPGWSRIETILYDQATVGYVPLPPEPPEGHYFTGWYAEKECVTPVAFTEDEANALRAKGENFQDYTIMPAHAILVYAGWETQWFKIEIDPDGGTLTGSQATWFWEPWEGDPIEEYNTVTKAFEPDVNGTYYYALRNRQYYGLVGEEWYPQEDTEYKNAIVDGHCTRGAFYTTDSGLATDTTATGDLRHYKEAEGAYRYLGWVEVDPVTGEEIPYNFGTSVVKNTYLRLKWKQLDTYLIEYRAGEGTIATLDSNEQTFEFLNADNYADHAEVVVTHFAVAPPGKNFVGWQIKNDGSGKTYYPGQSFHFDSGYAETVPQIDDEGHITNKRLIVLNAVYREITNAKIIYDPNGGNVDTRALTHGGGQDPGRTPEIYTDGASTPLEPSYKLENNRLIVSDLMNNAAVRLADGIGFTNAGYNLRRLEHITRRTKRFLLPGEQYPLLCGYGRTPCPLCTMGNAGLF